MNNYCGFVKVKICRQLCWGRTYSGDFAIALTDCSNGMHVCRCPCSRCFPHFHIRHRGKYCITVRQTHFPFQMQRKLVFLCPNMNYCFCFCFCGGIIPVAEFSVRINDKNYAKINFQGVELQIGF